MPDKPTVTNEHLLKYEEIMKTGTLDNGTPQLPTEPKAKEEKPKSGKIASMLASIPKGKGIGNKIFIFNGKKKIIMDEGEKEVENAKTVDAKEIKKLQKEEEKKDEETLSLQPQTVKVEEVKEAEKKLEKKDGKVSHTENSGSQKKKEKLNEPTPKGLIFGGIALLVVWTAAWAYFLGFFSLLGL